MAVWIFALIMAFFVFFWGEWALFFWGSFFLGWLCLAFAALLAFFCGKFMLECLWEIFRIKKRLQCMRYLGMAGLLGLSAVLIGCASPHSVPIVSHDTVVVSPAKALLEPVPLEPFGGQTNEDLLEYVLLLSGKLELCNARILSAKKMIDEEEGNSGQNGRPQD